MFAILGSGFGIYGYLPALVDECAQRIVLPERYRARFCERSELARFANDVQWEVNEDAALNCVDGAVLALRPINQSEWIHQCLARSKINRLLLEKPLAHTPEIAAVIFDGLIRSRKVFRIGYTFRYTAWGQHILKSLNATKDSVSLSIHWGFLAHHFRHDLQNWKRSNAAGGGALRFYGIHLIALLAEIGYREVNLSRTFGASEDEVEKWIAIFAGTGLPECEVVVDARSTVREFRAEQIFNTWGRQAITVFANLTDPFDSGSEPCLSGGIDERVPILRGHCHSLWEEGKNEYEWYDATIKLWRSIEEKTQFEICRVNSQSVANVTYQE